MRNQLVAIALTLACGLALSGFKKAAMRLPEALAGVEAMQVAGHQVRTLNKPMSFGAFRAEAVKEGFEFSWSVEAFGVRGGSARKRYRFVLHGPEGEHREVECRSRSIEAWRDGWTVELTDAFTPRLACGIQQELRLLRLVVGSRDGTKLEGALVESAGAAAGMTLRSVHRLEGTPLPLDRPAGYALARAGADVGAVETLNRGRVWLAPGLEPQERADAAAVAAALLLYDPEITPQLD